MEDPKVGQRVVVNSSTIYKPSIGARATIIAVTPNWSSTSRTVVEVRYDKPVTTPAGSTRVSGLFYKENVDLIHGLDPDPQEHYEAI